MKSLRVIAALLVFGFVVAVFFRKTKWPLRESVDVFPNSEFGREDEKAVQDKGMSSREKRTLDYSEPQRILLGGNDQPDQVKKALDVVSFISERLHWKEDEAVEITETETEIIVVWPSRHEGTGARHADYEARAVIDKKTFAIVSLKRGS